MRTQGGAAMRVAARNKAARWTTVADPANPQRIGSACYRPLLSPKFQTDRQRPVFALGSCFAEHIQYALAGQGLKPVSLIMDAPDASDQNWFNTVGPDGTSIFYTRSFFHRYNMMSLLQEIERLLLPHSPLHGDALLISTPAGEVRDFHYHEHYPLDSIASSVERRQYVHQRLQSVRQCGLFIITLGLVEAWLDRSNGLFLNTAPPFFAIAAEQDRYEFVVLEWPQLVEAGRRIVALLKSELPGIKIVFTVSPVPLDVTFTSADVAVATMHAKSTLVSVARKLASDDPDVDYFPSYEMAMLSDRAAVWMDDLRHVAPGFVTEIMEHFSSTTRRPSN